MNDDWISYPVNDGDIDGIYQYLGWHMRKAGMSSNCFHFLEVLKKRATHVYIESEPGLLTVGFYDPQGKWHPESDHGTKKEAASRVAWLNGANVSFKE